MSRVAETDEDVAVSDGLDGSSPGCWYQSRMQRDLWDGVGRLIDRSSSLPNLRAHGLQMLAVWHWRGLGRAVPEALEWEELVCRQTTFNATAVLRAAREAYDGRILVLKGPEVAARYPDPYLRPFSDLDLLVDDVEKAQRALLAAGFAAVGPYEDSYYERLHHARPLLAPSHSPPIVELHRAPNWVKFGDPPGCAELMDAAVPSSTGLPGLLALAPAHHAVVLAAHSWGEKPLRGIRDLIDVTALAGEADPGEMRRIAARWELSRVWDTTIAVADAVLFGQRRPWAMRIWARDLETVRDRTVWDDHVRNWLGPYWALPPLRAAVAMGNAFAEDMTPAPTETWSNKLARARLAIAHPARAHNEHKQHIGTHGIQPRHKRR